jgi:hypothetical protein
MGDGDMFYDNWKYSQLRQTEMQKKAEAARLVNLVMGQRPSWFHHLVLARLGGMMVAFGRKLHQRYAPAPRRTYAPSVIVAPQSAIPSMATWYVNEKDCKQEISSEKNSQASFFRVTTSRGHKRPRNKTNR